MKKIILLSIFATSICFTNCKKKNDPAPIPATTTKTTTGTPAPTSPSGSLTVNGVTQSFDVTIYNGGTYLISGKSSTGKYNTFEAGYVNSSPTSATIDLSSNSQPGIDFYNSTTTYSAVSGTAKITVNGASVTVEFTNAIFAPQDGTANVTASGKLVGINK